MKTFSKEKKQFWIDTMQSHQEEDRLIQGGWWDGEKGCFFGCAMKTEDYALDKAIEEMELPPWLIYLSEKIFEGLPKELALNWPVRLLTAIPFDADISEVRHKLAVVRLTGLISDKNRDQVNEFLSQAVDYHKDTNRNEEQRSAAWSAARSAESAATSATRSAARSAESAAWSAAWSATRSAESASWSAESAARSAARSAESAARSEAWSAESDNLIKILNNL